MLMKSPTQSLTQQLCERFAERIRSRLLAPGARPPSVRLCAEQQGVSVSTVVAACDQLQAQGLVVACKNSGFFVRDVAFRASNSSMDQLEYARAAIKNIATDAPIDTPEATPDGAAKSGRREAAGSPGADLPASVQANTQANSTRETWGWMAARPAPVDATALIRGMFQQVSAKPQPGMGVFPPDWLETSFLPAAVRKVTTRQSLRDFSLQYVDPKGGTGLRRALSQKLGAINVHAGPEQIVTTVGATHALDVVSRTLLRAGDCVMV